MFYRILIIYFSLTPSLSSQINISKDIYHALTSCYEETSEQALIVIFDTLDDKIKSSKVENDKYKYWQSYTKMFLYTYTKNIEHLDRGIEILEKEINMDNSEEYALLAYIKAYKMSTIKDKQVLLNLYKESKKKVEKSLELNNNNPRALYVKSLLDYYTTSKEKKKKIKQQLERVIHIYQNNNSKGENNYYSVNWGANLAHELLIRYYLKMEKAKQAKKIFKDAIKMFPSDYLINQYYDEFRE